MVAYTFNLSTKGAEADRSLRLKPVWSLVSSRAAGAGKLSQKTKTKKGKRR